MPENFNLTDALADENTPKGLREWAEKQAADNKALSDKLAKIEAAQRKTSIAEALKAKGLPEKVAAFYPQDADASEEAVAKWVQEYADVFGAAAPKTESEVPEVADHNPLSGDVLAAMRAVQDATPAAGANTPTLADRFAALDRLDLRSTDTA